MRPRTAKQQAAREANRPDVSRLHRRIRALLDNGPATAAEVCAELPTEPPRDVRRALLDLHRSGEITRVLLATDGVIYARREVEA
jgi:hypothetical protein